MNKEYYISHTYINNNFATDENEIRSCYSGTYSLKKDAIKAYNYLVKDPTTLKVKICSRSIKTIKEFNRNPELTLALKEASAGLK